MAMTARLLTISALAVELNKDRRTISRALSRVPPDGEVDGAKAWFLTTVLRAFAPSEGDTTAAVAKLEYAANRMCEVIERLRSEPDIEKRRRMVEDGQGRAVGEFVDALENVRSADSEAKRNVEQPYIDRMVGCAIGELFALCHWKIDS